MLSLLLIHHSNMLPLLAAIPKRLPFIGDVLSAILDDSEPSVAKHRRFPEFS